LAVIHMARVLMTMVLVVALQLHRATRIIFSSRPRVVQWVVRSTVRVALIHMAVGCTM